MVAAVESDNLDGLVVDGYGDVVGFFLPVDIKHGPSFHLFDFRQYRPGGSRRRTAEPVGRMKLKINRRGESEKNEEVDPFDGSIR